MSSTPPEAVVEEALRALEDVPTRRIADVGPADLVVVRGAVAPAGSALLDSPLTDEHCLMWSVLVHRPPHRATVLEEQSGCDFWVTDPTGSARVDGRDALFVTSRRARSSGEAVPDRVRALLADAGLVWDELLTCELAELRVGDVVAVRGVARIVWESGADPDGYRGSARSVAIDAAPDRRVIVALGAPQGDGIRT